MADVPHQLTRRRFGETMRRDAWWVQPAVVFLVLSSFIVYATWAAFQGAHYTYGPYLSPFYSPELFGDSPHAWFGPKPGWWPAWLPFSPALLILPFPGLFRLTCYYYRGAYYKAFWADPPACAVGEPRNELPGRGVVSARSCRTSTATSSTSRSVFLRHPGLRRVEGALVHRSGDRADVVRHRRRHAGARRSTSSCSAATRSAATRCATSSAAASTSSRGRPVRTAAYDCVELPQPRRTCGGPGAACSRWRSPTSTSGSARWASGTTVRIF